MPRSSVDEQIVKMSFDNSNFDSNINDSIKTLNALDQRLEAFGNRNNLDELTAGINRLANTLTVKGKIMLGIFDGLGKEILKFGINVKNKLFKGIKDGLGEYHQIIESTQTIYQNVKQSGATINDVNAALDELNDYADKTIYNFGQMTSMIGKFTAAGVGLKKSVSTIKGLSNAAALVGANMQRAQIGWNAVSRAMSSGKFTNMTWRSLELSNIAGKQFNKVITEVARNMHVKGKKTGKDIDGMIKKYGSLRESLQEGWLNKKVFTEAMNIMSGAMSKADMKQRGYSDKQITELMRIAEAAEEAATRVKTFKQLLETTGEAIGSGWAQSFRILIGDLEQAKKLYTRISNVISDFIDNNANIRNNLFKLIVDRKDAFNKIGKEVKNGKTTGVIEIIKGWESGREKFTAIIENMLAVIKTFLKSVKTGFLNIFPIERIAAAARKVLDVFKRFTRALVLNREELNADDEVLGWDTKNIEAVTDAIKDLIKFFRGLASVVDIAWMAISQPLKEIMLRIPFFYNFFDTMHNGIVNFTRQLGKFGDRLTVIRTAAKDFNIFGAATEYLIDNFEKIARKNPLLNSSIKVYNKFKSAIASIKESLNSLNLKPLLIIFGLFKMVVNSLWNGLNNIANFISDISKDIDWSWLTSSKDAIFEILKVLDAYGKGLIKFEEATEKIANVFREAWNNIVSVFRDVPILDIFKGLVDTIKQIFENIVNIVSKIFGKFGTEVGKSVNGNDTITKGIGKVKDSLADVNIEIDKIDKNVTLFSNSINNIEDSVTSLVSPVKSASNSLMLSLDKLDTTFDLDCSSIGNSLVELKNDAKDFEETTIGTFETLEEKTGILGFFSNIINKVKEFVSNIELPFKSLAKNIALIGGGTAVAAFGISKLIKTVKSIKMITDLSSLVGSGIDVLKAYETQIKSKAIFNIAISIGILASAMLTLAFIPYDRLENGLTVFVGFMGILAATLPRIIRAMSGYVEAKAKLNESMKKPLPVNHEMNIFEMGASIFRDFANSAKEVGLAMAKGFNSRMIGKAILDVAIAVAVLVGSMIALKLAFKPDEIIQYGAAIIALMGALTTSVLILLTVIEGFTKSSEALRPSVGIFASFFKLAGVSSVILAIAAATLILAGAFAILSKIDSTTLANSVIAFLTIFMSLSALVTAVTAIAAKSDPGKTNKIAISLIGVMLSVAAIFSVLSEFEDVQSMAVAIGGVALVLGSMIPILKVIGSLNIPANIEKITSLVLALSVSLLAIVSSLGLLISLMGLYGTNAWIGPLTSLGIIFSLFSGSIVALTEVAKHVGQSAVWMQLSITIGMLSGAILSIGAAMYAIGRIPKIDNSVLLMFGMLTFIIESILAVAVVIGTIKKGFFSETFISTLMFISIAISGVAVAISMAAGGIAAIVKAFNNIEVSSKDMSNASQRITDKLASIGTMILSALPALVDLFSKIGYSIGSVFVSFIDGFVTRIAESGDQYAQLADKIVNVVLNILDKVGTSLYNRKEDIAIIIEKYLKIITGAITVAINTIFNGKEGATKVSEGTVSKWLGLGTILTLVGAFSVKFIGILKGLWSVITTVASGIKTVIIAMTNGAALSTAQIAAYFAALVVAIYSAYAAMNAAYHGIRQLEGTEAAYHNAEINSVGEALKNLFTNAEFRLQSFIYGFTFLGRVIIQVVMTVVRAVVGTVSRAVQVILKTILWPFERFFSLLGLVNENCKNIANGIKDISKSFGEVADNSFSDIAKGWKEVGNFEIGTNDWANYSAAKKSGENITKGMADGLSNYGNVVASTLALGDAEGKRAIKIDWGIASPSKVAEKLYGQIPKGAKKGLESGMKTLKEYFNEQNFEMINTLRNLTVGVKDSSGVEREIELNSQLLEIMEKETDALVGKTQAEAMEFLATQAQAAGIANYRQESAKLVGTLWAQQEGQEQLTAKSIQRLSDMTRVSMEQIVGESGAANALVLANYLHSSEEMANIATDHAYELVGVNKAKAQQILKDEAIARGMNEEEADQHSKNLVKFMFAQNKSKNKLTSDAILDGIDMYKKEEENYKTILQKETADLQEALNKRQKMTEKANENMQKGVYKDVGSYQAEMRAIENEYNKAVSKYNKAVKEVEKDLKKNKRISDKTWEDQYKKTINAINKNKSNSRGGFKGLLDSFINTAKNGVADALDLGSWKTAFNNNNTNTLKDNDKNNKDAVNAAKKTKQDLEKNRADLTPTFDLDKLSDEAKKANGIVMSSLMAAQNASIGDYINTDSELNPFMKDRWQNVYNFTQNNYSPKALSRIDIYRQTQRQISMSRGF